MGGRALLVTLGLIAAGCRGKEQRVKEAMDAASSASATLSMLAAAHAEGAVSRPFARTTCDALYRQLEKERSSVAGTPADRADARLGDAAARLERVAAEVASLAKTLDEGAAH
jgi:hypothetical protein